MNWANVNRTAKRNGEEHTPPKEANGDGDHGNEKEDDEEVTEIQYYNSGSKEGKKEF